MSFAAARPQHTRSDYLGLERSSPTKHEFVGGQILGMAGAKPRHNLVTTNAVAALRERLRERCAVLSSDQRVTVEATGDSFYPDVVVVCGEWALDEDGHGVKNPSLVVEVASPTTAAYDRLEKLPQYKSIPALRDALVVDPATRRVEHHRRLETGQWLVSEVEREGVLELGVGAELPLAELFEGLDRVPDVP
jgi:Uma2 family endonuclease